MIWVVMVLTPVVGAGLSWTLCRSLVVPMLSRLGVLDHPSARSSHDTPVVRGGGVGVVIGWAVSFGVGMLILSAVIGDDVGRAVPVVAAGWGLVIVYTAIGLVDDLNSLPAGLRLGLQTAAAALFAAVFVWTTPIGFAGGAAIALTAVLVVNSVNFMDGLNTLITSWAILCGAWFAVAALLHENLYVGAMAACLAAAALGFLPLNVTPARVFLGDSGSYAIGAGAAAMLWAHWASGGSIVVAAAPFVIPLFDVLTTLVRRMFAHENIFEAHRTHIYQRLQQMGLSHETSSAVHTAAVLACCTAAIPSLMGAGSAGACAAFAGWALVSVMYALAPAVARAKVERAIR